MPKAAWRAAGLSITRRFLFRSSLFLNNVDRASVVLQFPERMYKLPTGVTSLDFSSEFPNFLAVGLYDGNICIFDVSTEDSVPILTTA